VVEARVFAATGDSVARLELDDGQAVLEPSLQGSGAQCVAVDPRDGDRIYAGTFDDGIYRSLDGGRSWDRVGEGIPKRVLSVAISETDREGGRSVVYAGSEPSGLYRSTDDGRSWQDLPALRKLPSAPSWSFPPRPWTSHVRWIALHAQDPELLFVGIELGGVMRSRDRGRSWEDRKHGSYHDAHALVTHPLAPARVYEAAGEGVALSEDGGDSWRQVDDGMDRHYTWGLAVDPADPDLWYVSASHGPSSAHRSSGQAEAVIYRKRGAEPWQPLGGGEGLKLPLDYMPYALLTLRGRAGAARRTLLAGLRSGQLLLSDDAGDSWRELDQRLPKVLALSESAG
jgi:photosystem II stability/assembly factor-like uncharacterized protein